MKTMTTSWIGFRGAAVLAAAALLAAGLLGCEAEAPSREVAGARAARSPAPLPTAILAAPTPLAIPTAVPATVPTAAPLPPGPTTAPPRESDLPPPISRALANVYSDVEFFQGVVAVTLNSAVHGPTTTLLRQWYKRPNLAKLEVIKSGEGRAPVGTTLIFDGKKLTLYDPEVERVLVVEGADQMAMFLNLPQEPLLPMLQLFQVQQSLPTLASRSIASIVGTERIGKRTTTVVELVPRTATPRFQRVRLWIAEVTGVPLRTQALGANGAVQASLEYLLFERVPYQPIADEAFTFTPPTSAKVVKATREGVATAAGFQPMNRQEVSSLGRFAVFQPATLPGGARLESLWAASFDGAPMVAILYGTDQGATVALVERPIGPRPPLLRGTDVVEVGGTTAEVYRAGEMVVIDWVRGDTSLSLVSTLPGDQALNLARAIR